MWLMSQGAGCVGLATPPVVQALPSVFRFPQDVDRAEGAGGVRLTVQPNTAAARANLRLGELPTSRRHWVGLPATGSSGATNG